MGTIRIQNERCMGPSIRSPSTFLFQFQFLSLSNLRWNGQTRLEDEVGIEEKQGTGIFSWTPPTFFHVASSRELQQEGDVEIETF